jgi:hypothetical protein
MPPRLKLPSFAADKTYQTTDSMRPILWELSPSFVIPGCAPAGDSRSECRPGIHSAMDSGLADAALHASHAPRNDDCCWSLLQIDMIRISK